MHRVIYTDDSDHGAIDNADILNQLVGQLVTPVDAPKGRA